MDRGAETPIYRCSRRYWTWRNSAYGELCCFNNMAGWIQPGEKGIWFNVKDELKIIWWIVNIGGTIMQSEVSDWVNYHSRAAINFMANLLIPFFWPNHKTISADDVPSLYDYHWQLFSCNWHNNIKMGDWLQQLNQLIWLDHFGFSSAINTGYLYIRG